MVNSLVKSSDMLELKSKFFLSRLVTYFFFLLFPIWAQKTLDLPPVAQVFIMVLYVFFMTGQWYLLGKEVDHRLKVYFRVNSSMDRVVYRLLLGMIFMFIYFNILSFLSAKWIYNLFWLTWVFLGLFYSWPTRGKIVQESVTSNFSEFRYLDSFEKTLVALILIVFIFSFPELPNLTSRGGLQLFFDPKENFSIQVWNFLVVNYYPFQSYPELLKVAWSVHFYFVGLGLFLLCFYALLRFFVSRRLSLLGVFALITSWSFSKILMVDYGAAISTTFSVFWVWSFLWSTKSGTYRSGLFLGLVNYYGVLLNQKFIFLFFIQLGLLYFIFMKDKTLWFRKQLLRYSLFGGLLSLGVVLVNLEKFGALDSVNREYWPHLIEIFSRKSIFSLSVLGFFLLLIYPFMSRSSIFKDIHFDSQRLKEVISVVISLIVCSFLFEKALISSFSLLWIFCLLSLVPIEMIFQSISRLRSRRNIIYVLYILICLLDSHFEGRVKIFINLL